MPSVSAPPPSSGRWHARRGPTGSSGSASFPATLAIDDPFVADDLSLPTVSFMQFGRSGDSPAYRQTDISSEFSKRLSPNLGFSLAGDLVIGDPDKGTTQSGFDNIEVSLKYVFWKSAAHETLLSAGVSWDVGGTGSKRVGAESFDTVTPQLFFGKGMGDLSDSLSMRKPAAITGAFGFAIPTRRYNKTISVEDSGDEDSGGQVTVDKELNPQVFHWGFTVQYNLQYLQSFVRDVGLPAPFNRMIPIVEVALETPVQGPDSGRTTGTVNPVIIWFGRYIQLGLELQIPINRQSGKNVGCWASSTSTSTTSRRRSSPGRPSAASSGRPSRSSDVAVGSRAGPGGRVPRDAGVGVGPRVPRPLGPARGSHGRPAERGADLVRWRDRARVQHDPRRGRQRAEGRPGRRPRRCPGPDAARGRPARAVPRRVRVFWSVVAPDGHRTEGSYPFRVR